MKVYVAYRWHGYDDGPVVVGVYSSHELAEQVPHEDEIIPDGHGGTRTFRCYFDIDEIELDAPAKSDSD
jgi:hypothetical protein